MLVCQVGSMAQLVAHWSNKPTVVGSSPTGTTFCLRRQDVGLVVVGVCFCGLSCF
jgi:hypothetical protein